jgi:nicotinamide phosphoribosyltransferase
MCLLTNFLKSLFFRFGTQLLLQRFLEVKKVVLKAFKNSTSYDDANDICWYVLNDFGFRGVSSVQSAKHGGSAI